MLSLLDQVNTAYSLEYCNKDSIFFIIIFMAIIFIVLVFYTAYLLPSKKREKCLHPTLCTTNVI